VVQNFHAWAERYDAKVDAFIAGPFSKAAIDEKLARWKQQILTAGFPVQEDAISQLGGILDRARINRGYAY
jgi:hypothetical protein